MEDRLFLFGPNEEIMRCRICKTVKPIEEFYPKAASGYYSKYLDRRCKPCQAKQQGIYRRQNPERFRAAQKRQRQKKQANGELAEFDRKNHLWIWFKLTVAHYGEILKSQGGVCAICQKVCKSGRRLAVDHDRSCCSGGKSCGKCVRGLLCMNCNRAIGHLQEDIESLYAAIAYLEKWRK